MSDPNNTGNATTDAESTAQPEAPADEQTPSAETEIPPASKSVPRTRMSAVWMGICIAAALFVVLIVFMLQNTREVEIAFLWMNGSAPLAVALLIAAVGTAILAAIIGSARIAQLRRHSRRQH